MDRAELTPALRNELTELIGRIFRPKEVDHLGGLLFKGYDSNALCGEPSHVSLTSRRCGEALVELCEQKGRTAALIKLLADLDGNTLMGREIEVEGLELFLSHLAREGRVFDRRSGRILDAGADPMAHPGWGALRDGKLYRCTVASLDVVASSSLVRRYGQAAIEKVSARLWSFLSERLARYEARRWSWAGDGGLLAFAFHDHVARAVVCALELQRSLAVFNLHYQDVIPEQIEVRIGIDTGEVRYHSDTGSIVSDVVNFAAHLEKKAAVPGAIAVSEDVYRGLRPKLASLFGAPLMLEGRLYRTTARLDTLYEPLESPMRVEQRPRARRSAAR